MAMNIISGTTKLVLLCPGWKKWGRAKYVKPCTVILHSRVDDVVPFVDSEELARNSGAKLIEIGNDHRLADPEPLEKMLRGCEEQLRSVETSGVRKPTQIRHNIAHAKPLLVQCMTHVRRAEASSQLLASQRKPTQVSY